MYPTNLPSAEFINKVRAGMVAQPNGCIHFASRSGVCRACPTVLYGKERISVRKLLAQAGGTEGNHIYSICKNKMCVAPAHATTKHPGREPLKDRRTGVIYDSEKDRFLSRVKKSSGCWVWTGHTDHDGYGTYRPMLGLKVEKAHRVSFKLFRGPIPQGLFICHKCNVRDCVNPDHLYAGTPAENTADAIAAGTAASVRSKNGERFYRHSSIRCMQICWNCKQQYGERKSAARVRKAFNFCGRQCRIKAQQTKTMPNALIDTCRQDTSMCGKKWHRPQADG